MPRRDALKWFPHRIKFLRTLRPTSNDGMKELCVSGPEYNPEMSGGVCPLPRELNRVHMPERRAAPKEQTP